MPTRREFCQIATVLAAATLIPERLLLARMQKGELTIKALSGTAWLIAGGGGNVLVFKTGIGTVVVDAKVAGVASEFEERLKETTPRHVSTLINTHHHADHIGGNFIFHGKSRVIAHKNLKPRIANALENRIRPALKAQVKAMREAGDEESAKKLAEREKGLTIEHFAASREVGSALNLAFAGVEVVLKHYGPGHTDNDLVVWIPTLNILHAGDLLFHNMYPYIDRPAGATTVGWQRAVRIAAALCDEETIVIPGHGEVGDKSLFDKQIRFFDDLRALVRSAMDAGEARDEIIKLKPEPFAGLGLSQLREQALGAMYDELAEQGSDS